MGLFNAIGRMIRSPLTYMEANRVIQESKERLEIAKEELDDNREHFRLIVNSLGEKKLGYASNLLAKVERVLTKVRENLNFTENQIAKEADLSFSENTLPKVKKVSIGASEVLKTGALMGSSAAAISAGALGLVAMLGTASTGTAISTLSGAAAVNSSLAWLGGGSVVAGGMGMKAGAVVLGGIALAPVAILGAVVFAGHAEKKLTAAKEYEAKTEIAIEQINGIIIALKVLERHFFQFELVMDSIAEKLDTCLDQLNRLNSEGVKGKPIEIAFFSCVLLTKTLKKLLDINLMDSEGKPGEESTKVIAHAECFESNTEATDKLLSAVVANEKTEEPIPSHKLPGLEPGNDSVKYFWFQDIRPGCLQMACGCVVILGIGCLAISFLLLFF